MTKGELRKQRKQAHAEGRPWSVETNEHGQLEVVREHTPREKHRHERAMALCARLTYEYDRDF